MKKTLRFKFAFLFAVSIIIIFSMFCTVAVPVSNNANAEKSTPKIIEKKAFCDATLEDEFESNSVLVVLNKNVGGINKRINENIFKNINYTTIKDLTHIDNPSQENEYVNLKEFNQILKIELKTKSKQNVLNVIKKLEQKSEVLYARPNYSYSIETSQQESTGVMYDEQWGLNGEYGIQAEEAWNITTGSGSVRVGVMDSGIAAHNDLNANLVSGWDFINDVAITGGDGHGHGTHVAGIIGATGSIENGVAGVNKEIDLVPMVVAEPTFGLINSDDVVEAITWATNNYIDIINFSAGGAMNNDALKDALNNYNGLFVCAAGNDSNDNDIEATYPSDFSQGQEFSDRVISVGSIDSNGDISSFSNYGANTVSLFAPGENILSTYPAEQCTGETQSTLYGTFLKCELKLTLLGWAPASTHCNAGYHYMSGTSMATPFVTGTAALLYAQYLSNSHELTRGEISAQIKETILENVTHDDRYNDKCISGGRLNAFAALKNMQYRQIANNFGYTTTWYKWHGKINLLIEDVDAYSITDNEIVFNKNTTLSFAVGTEFAYNAWKEILSNITFELKNSSGELITLGESNRHVCNVRVGLVSNVSYTNRSFEINLANLVNDTYTLTMYSVSRRDDESVSHTKTFTFTVNKTSSCVTPGTMITLADGSTKAVENLTGNEMLLVWNMFTGEFDSAPILFIDSDPAAYCEVITLTFSDGTEVEVIDEHGFWNIDLNEYVFLRADAAQYIGDMFNKQSFDENGNMIYTAVELIGVETETVYTTAWSPVTQGHLCYYVNGMLSMPGATTGLINIFEVDAETMTIDEEAFEEDINTYGVFTYEEFCDEIAYIPESVFQAFGGVYLKVALGKGILTTEMLEELIIRYSVFWETEE